MKRRPDTPEQHHQDDVTLFRATVGEVRPLPRQNRIEPQKVKRRPLLHASEPPAVIPDVLSDFGPENSPEEFLRNGLTHMTLRRLRRGKWPIQDSLDLHGNNGDAARRLLQEFLHEAAQHELRCVLVIHGKGVNSPGGEGILRRLTRNWLAQRPDVLAYCNAPPSAGGSGAALVLLKTSF